MLMILILMGNGSPDLDTAKDSASPVVIGPVATCEVVEEVKCFADPVGKQVKPVAIKTQEQIYLQPWDEAIQALQKIDVQQKKIAEIKSID